MLLITTGSFLADMQERSSAPDVHCIQFQEFKQLKKKKKTFK